MRVDTDMLQNKYRQNRITRPDAKHSTRALSNVARLDMHTRTHYMQKAVVAFSTLLKTHARITFMRAPRHHDVAYNRLMK